MKKNYEKAVPKKKHETRKGVKDNERNKKSK